MRYHSGDNAHQPTSRAPSVRVMPVLWMVRRARAGILAKDTVPWTRHGQSASVPVCASVGHELMMQEDEKSVRPWCGCGSVEPCGMPGGSRTRENKSDKINHRVPKVPSCLWNSIHKQVCIRYIYTFHLSVSIYGNPYMLFYGRLVNAALKFAICVHHHERDKCFVLKH